MQTGPMSHKNAGLKPPLPNYTLRTFNPRSANDCAMEVRRVKPKSRSDL